MCLFNHRTSATVHALVWPSDLQYRSTVALMKKDPRVLRCGSQLNIGLHGLHTPERFALLLSLVRRQWEGLP